MKFKREERENINIEIVEYNLQLHAHNGKIFDSWIKLNNPCDKHIVDMIKNGKGTISLRIFKGYINIMVKNKFLKIQYLDVVRLI